ncbi:ABC transporter permease [Pseudomonas sp. Choline-3u-10]|jgi:branched-chain amino acid transport system substrate-binding protein|uniref:ABC transporter permease n=1 Tax=Stutzerimonas stutzeri TaxID=316 RepID=A0A172WVB8_STUST|nr:MULTISPECIES: ABC transporter substrate-binding protein [Pseudomonadaceae]MAL35621.1 ABC transporter permease [Pseudomonas sp.]MBU0950502.1 ABC transporter substrate-binding protein [Gammaproteobacteria bacterium]ANF27346.1 ABC transporter permease [Stutzerimonas stutzeri]KJJ65260.1 ABC transporter permease [Pseudomonas sp. 10B238]MBK3795500.1 ABC transporter substrate-binding protein [Stutzerimonas stutzeri]
MKMLKKTAAAVLVSSMIASAAQAEISNDEIRIGYLADMSGTYRDLSGPGGLEALNMAIEDFGGTVDGKKIVTFNADDLNKPDVGANTVRQWIDERNVDMVTGLVASSVVLAAAKVVEQGGKLALISGAAASSITNEFCSPNHIHWTYDTFALANGTANAVLKDGGKSWFILTADYAFGHAMEADIKKVVEAEGGSVVGTVRHPFPSSDFSSYILQAQGSGADVIALANAGADTVNSLKTASEFGVTQSGQRLAGMVVFLNDIHAMGLDVTQGLMLTTGWYWDMDEEARAWAKRYEERVGSMPTMVHAGIYSAATHYLNAVKETGSDDTATVRAQMAKTPVNDMFAKNGKIREDGRMVHDMYLVQVKTPAESKGEWDLYKVIRTIPGDEAFRPLSESQCKLVTQN